MRPAKMCFTFSKMQKYLALKLHVAPIRKFNRAAAQGFRQGDETRGTPNWTGLLPHRACALLG